MNKIQPRVLNRKFLDDAMLAAAIGGGGGAPLGPELLNNGTFDDATAWSWGAPWNWIDTPQGHAHCDASGNGNLASQSPITYLAGVSYRVYFEIALGTYNAALLCRPDGTTAFTYDVDKDGPHEFAFISPLGAIGGLLFRNLADAFDGEVDNVSVREIL